MFKLTNNNLDGVSIGGFFLNYSLYVLSLMQFEQGTKICLMFISGIAGVTTIIYNIKKMKK
jgi:hypothetical protein